MKVIWQSYSEQRPERHSMLISWIKGRLIWAVSYIKTKHSVPARNDIFSWLLLNCQWLSNTPNISPTYLKVTISTTHFFDNAQISQKELIQIIKDLWFFVFLNNNIELQIKYKQSLNPMFRKTTTKKRLFWISPLMDNSPLLRTVAWFDCFCPS